MHSNRMHACCRASGRIDRILYVCDDERKFLRVSIIYELEGIIERSYRGEDTDNNRTAHRCLESFRHYRVFRILWNKDNFSEHIHNRCVPADVLPVICHRHIFRCSSNGGCNLHDVKEEQFPDLDDEFAKDVSEFDTLDELKKQTKKDLQESKDKQAENAAKDALIEKIYDANKVDVPKVMVEDEIDNMSQELDQQLRYQGLSLDQYLQYMQKDKNAFRDELREEATKKVGTRLVLRSIAEAEKIEVTEAELDEELKTLAEQYRMEVDQVKQALEGGSMDFFKKDIVIRKVIDMLYDEAKVNKTAAPKAKTTTKKAPAKKSDEKKAPAKKTAAKKTEAAKKPAVKKAPAKKTAAKKESK